MNRWYVMIGLGLAALGLGYFALSASFGHSLYLVLGFVSFFLGGILLLIGTAMLLSTLTSREFAASPSFYIGCLAAAAVLTALLYNQITAALW